MATKTLPEHGTPTRYLGTRTGSRPPCRCRPCIDAHSRGCRERQLARLNGQPPRVPTEPITDHVHALLNVGMSRTQIAIAAGVSIASVCNAANAKTPTTNRRTARLILAVRPCVVRPTDRVPAHGTRRRLQALYAIGHGALAISAATGITTAGVQNIIYGRAEVVTAATYRSVRAAYRQLAGKPGASSRAKASARRNGWLTPAAWDDDIDRASAQPDLDDPDRRLNRDELAAVRRAEIEHLWHLGIPEGDIKDRLGMSLSTVRAIVAELRTGQKRNRKQVAA